MTAWDSNNGHSLGANYLGLNASAAPGVVPENPNGYNIEGLTSSSRLIVTNTNVAPVPEPLTILGSVTALALGANMQRRFGKSR